MIERIVSLVPSGTEILYFLGLESKVVGVTEHCNFPPAVVYKEKVGTFAHPHLAKILALKPDLVLVDKLLHHNLIADLDQAGVLTINTTPANTTDLFAIMNRLLEECCLQEHRSKVEQLFQRVEACALQPISKPLRVFYLMSTEPCFTPGPGSCQFDAFSKAGAVQICEQGEAPYVQVSWQELVEFDPEVIFFCGVEKGQSPPARCKGCSVQNPPCCRTFEDVISDRWCDITAVKRNKVYPIACSTICRPGPRLIEGIEKLHNILSQASEQTVRVRS